MAMDERHWWFASKLQETFHFGGYDNPTVLEDFLSDPEVVDLINDFLAPGEPRKLFFHCDEPARDGSRTPSASRRLHATSELTADSVNRGKVCLYVLRAETDGEVDATQMERELFCGELRHSVLSSLASLLSEAYTPLLHSQKNWGECNDATVTNFLQNFDKFSSTLLETATLAQTQRPILQRPSLELGAELQHLQGRSVLSAETVGECEGLVGEWVNSIDGLLLEATDERMENPWFSPLSELSKWRQRHCLLLAVVEQLKVKETRSVFTVLVAAKSRMLRKWKTTDTQLTEAFNNARDRVHYLESLSPHLEALEANPSLPTLLSSLLLAISTAVKQMEGLSRAYARSGYLGILFIKISNALVRVCTASLRAYCTGPDDKDMLWDILSSVVEAQIKSDQSQIDHPFLTQLSLCLQVASAFKETLHHLRDVLITQHRVGFSTPSHSVGPSTVSLSGTRKTGTTPTNPLARDEGGNRKGTGLAVPTVRNTLSPGTVSSYNSGVSLHSVDVIAASMNEMSSRVTQVIEIVSTLSQFRKLVGNLKGLPRVSGLWATVPVVADTDVGSLKETDKRGIPIAAGSVTTSDYVEQVFGQKDYPLPEQEKPQESTQPSSTDETSPSVAPPPPPPPLPPSPSSPTSPSLSDSIAKHLHSSLKTISTSLASSCGRGISEVFSITGRSKSTFPTAYNAYSSQISTLEGDISNYLRTVISRSCSSKDALDIITRFASVHDRATVKEAIHDCSKMAFEKYSSELEDIHASYERNKGHPPISPSLPPIAGSLSWCREMLRRVAGPMETFRENSTVMQSVSSLEVCKVHNRLSTALLQYETLLITRWHSTIESAQAALGLPLLVQDTNGKIEGLPHIRVNCQKSLLDVMAESKALSAAGIPIPEVVRHILTQEVRVKRFRQSLQQVLDDFDCTLISLDQPLHTLLASHIDTVIRCLLPGCSSLTWSSLNIDAFLHRATSTVSVFQTTSSRIQSILQEHVYSVLQDIAKSSLYDIELASSRAWAPHEFSEAMKVSITRKASSLYWQVAHIRRAVLATIAIAGGHEMADLKSNLLLAGLNKHGGVVSEEGSRNGVLHVTKQHSVQSTCITTASSSHGGRKGEGGRGEGVRGEGREEDEEFRRMEVGGAGKEALSYVCGLVFNAICETIARSHSQLSMGLAAGMGSEEQSFEEALTKLSRSFVDLSGQRTVQFQDSQTVDNPRAVLAEFASKFRNCAVPPLKLKAEIQLSIPRTLMEPLLSDIHARLVPVTSALLSVLRNLSWWAGPGCGREFHVMWDASGAVDHMHAEILERFKALEPAIDHVVSSLRLHDFIWREDMHTAYQHFLETNPTQAECCSHIERFLEVEKSLSEIPAVFTVGPLQLSAHPITHSLTALALAWKLEFADFLHKQAQSSLKALVDQREAMSCTLQQPVDSLTRLRDCLQLLLDISDLQNTIDDQYTPVEGLYGLLRRYTPSLPRSEVMQVDSLRDDWEALTRLTDTTRHRLLHEHRHIHERETEKQVRAFQVETIRFRNSFDTEGPLVPGLAPHAAMTRLDSFSQQCDELQARRSLLCAVETLLSLPLTSYPELDQTHTDLSHLHTLYHNYQKFLDFDENFRQTLWQDVHLTEAEETLEALWSNTAILPPEQQEWEGTRQLRTEICHYRDLIPLLARLHSKEVRNRHWLQVMRVTNCTFQLEGSIFRLAHLLEAPLMEHEDEIDKIVRCALKELELENEFRAIEEHWNEQILEFTSYKGLGEVLLDVSHTHSLCEGLEGAGVRLATMLVSDHVTHLRDEVMQWAGRLARVDEVLTQWLAVQERWRQLESVLTTPSAAKSFTEEATIFTAITSSWVELMTSARVSPGVVERCDGEVCVGKVRVGEVLGGLGERLEQCKKSLSLYLLSKRQAFPRFFYVSDDSLLQILSSPLSPSSLTPYLPSLFTNTRSLITQSPGNGEEENEEEDDPVIITAVESAEGERLDLTEPVLLCESVEQWVSLLLSATRHTLSARLGPALSTVSVEEVAREQLCQVATLTLYLHWTRDVEQALSQCRYDRRAIPGLRSKFTSSAISKLTHMLMRGRRRTGDETVGEKEREREKLEALAMLAVWLRDIIDDLCQQKIRGISDFEWQRFLRLYHTEETSTATEGSGRRLEFRCLHVKMEYGFEYHGCRSLPVFTPRMNSYMISLVNGMESGLHSMACGPQSSGKNEMIQGIAQLLGRFLVLYPCTTLSTTHTLARILEGIAQDGGWACLTDVDSLPQCVLSVVCHMIEAVSTALSGQQKVYHTPCGREALLQPHPQPGMLVVLSSSDRSWELPPSIGPLFRTFFLPPLAPSLYLLATCTALGLRGPRQLASKLSALHHLSAKQLRSALPLQALCHVLREVRHSSYRVKPVGGIPHHKSDGVRSDTVTGSHRTTDQHTSHRHLPGACAHSPVKEAHRGQKTISLMTTPPSSQPLPPSAAREHTNVAQLLVALLAPRFDTQEQPVFLEMVRCVFALDDSVTLSPHLDVGGASQQQTTPTPCVTGSDITSPTMDSILTKVIKKARLDPTETWLAKVKEILTLIQVTSRHIILAGQDATGKTTAINIAASAINAQSNQRSKVNIHRVYPGAFDNLSTLIGQFSSAGAWEDGVCVSLVRKGLKDTSSTHWVCLDGDPAHTWLHPMAELFLCSHTLCLPNGERVVGLDDCGLRLVLETGNLNTTSPAFLNSCGVVHFGSEVLSWQPLANVWLASRTGVERTCLRKQFATFMGPVTKMVCRGNSSVERCVAYHEVGLTEMCLAYLTSLLNVYNETAESFSAIHVVRLLVFSIIWSFGAVLPPGPQRQSFSHLLKSLTNSLPDDDTQYSVYDYYVDESGEWDVWQTRLPAPNASSTAVDLLGNVYVDTTDSVRVELLLDLALSAKRNVLMTGPSGCGKTAVCKHFLQARALSHMTSEGVCHLALDSHSSSSSLHHFMKVYMHHKQGFTYSPQDQKVLHLFIDDLHLPQCKDAAAPVCHEYIRQLIDCHGVYNLGKPNTFSNVEDLTLFTAMTNNSQQTLLHPRLQRHFAIINMPQLADAPLAAILMETLRTLCGGMVGAGTTEGSARISGDTLSCVVQSTVAVFLLVRDVLRESDMTGRQHYMFSLSHIESAFQGLYHCLSSASCPGVGFSWYHEMLRSMVDPLCRTTDKEWLTSTIHSHAEKLPGGLPSSLPLTLSAVPLEIKQGEEQPSFITTPINQLPEVELHPLSDWCDMEMTLNMFLMRCRQDWGDFPLSLSTNHIHCIIQLHRALKFPRGNSILCGPHGQQLCSIAKFSLYLAGYQLRHLDCSSSISFRSSLRALFRRAGLEGGPVAAILTERDLHCSEVVQSLNSLCATGELPTLFSNDEMNGILQALAPSIKKDFPSEETHPMHYLTGRITRYLRLVLCLSPSSPLLGTQAHSFRGLLRGCHMVWTPGWSHTELSHSLTHFFSTSPASIPLQKTTRTPLFNCLSSIHRLVLKQSGHLELAGHFPSPLSLSCSPETTTTGQDGEMLTSFPLLMENVLQIERELGGHNSSTGFAGEFKLPYVGPLTFVNFVENFCSIYSSKKTALKTEEKCLSKALEALERTSVEASTTKETLSTLEKEYSAVCEQCASLLKQLTNKSCQVERAKAVLGEGSSVMGAMQMTTEQEKAMADEHEDEDEMLATLLGVSLGKRGSRLEMQLESARERVLAAETEEREAREAMVTVKEEVLHYESSIDRNAIDQLKSLPSPPSVVCTVMQVMLTLLQQHRRGGGGGGAGGGVGKVAGVVSEDSVHSGNQSTSAHSQPTAHPQPHLRRTSLLQGTTHTPSSTTSLTKPPHKTAETKDQWAAIKLAIGDSQNFRDLITALHWEDGLTIEAVNLITSRLNVESRSEKSQRWSSTPPSAPAQQHAKVTFTAAKHAAEIVGMIFGFAVGMVEYTSVYQTHQLATDKLRRARERCSELQALLEAESTEKAGGRGGGRAGVSAEASDLSDVREEDETSEEGLHRLEEELKELQTEFNRSAVKKHSLDQTCTQLSEGLKSAMHLMESLQSRRKAWQHSLDHTPSHNLLLTNCILAAAITTYCAPYNTLSRHKLLLAMTELCRESELAPEKDSERLLRLEQYPEFMIGKPALHQLVLEGLPSDHTSCQSACMITCSHALSWPLVCDPFGLAADWLSRHGGQRTAVVDCESPNLHSQILTSLTSGSHLIVTGVSEECVSGDSVMMSVLQHRQYLRVSTDTQKMKIGEKEVEYNSSFKLTLVTASLPGALACELVAMTTVVLFWPEEGGIEGLLLDRLLWQQNCKIAKEREQFRKEVHQHSQRSEETEQALLDLLSHDHHHNDHRATRDLLQINTTHEDSIESLNKAQSSLEHMLRGQLSSLSALASRAALVSSVVMVTGLSHPLYAVSYDYLASVFLSFLEQAGSHIQGDEAVERLTHFAYHHFSRGMLGQDRLLFAFTLVLQIELSQSVIELSHGIITHREIRYLLHPTPSTRFAVKGLAAQAGMDLHEATPFTIGKRPYDWILESQWQAMLMLMSHFSWAQKAIQAAFIDDAQGLQATFRVIFQSKHPELYITSGDKKLDDKVHKFSRNLIHILLLNCSNRPDRLACALQVLSEAVLLPSKSSYDTPVALSKFYKSCSNERVPLIVYKDDSQLPVKQIRTLAGKLHLQLTVQCVHGTGEEELERVKEALAHAICEGGWLLLHNIQASPALIHQLPSLLRSHPASERWRLWLSVFAGATTSLPVALLNSVCRVVLDTPTSVRSSLLYNLHSLPPDLLTGCSRIEWLPLLHSCALLYAVLRERRKIHTTSWGSSCLPFRHTLFTDMMKYLQTVASQNEAGPTNGRHAISWSGIRYMLTEVFFGSVMCDPTDHCTLTSLIETWIHPGGPRKEPGLYHIPAVFFTPGTRQNALCQAVEVATPPPLVSAELCGLNPSPEIKIGQLETFLPALSSFMSTLYQHAPPTLPADHTLWTHPLPQGRTDYSTRHLLTPPGPVLERLPSWVHVPHQIMELNLSGNQVPILPDIGSNIWNLKQPLENTVRKIQEILPQGWRDDVLSEKLDRHDSGLPFRHFLKQETYQMNMSLHTIHSSLLSLLRALDPHSHGDPHTLTSTPHLSHLSLSLLSLTVPSLWLEAVGPTSPPSSWPLQEWVQDLAQRWVFLDQLLSLGLGKVPTYWLGAFFHPDAFLSVLTQSVLKSQCSVSGATEDTFFLAEVTSRNKDHIRDPPPEGELFVFGSYLWGCRIERSATIEFHDAPPKQQSPTPLPLLHLALTTATSHTATGSQTANEPGGKGAESKANLTYHCPVFLNHSWRCPRERRELFRVLVHNSEVTPTKWTTRSISCTLRPF